MIPEDMVHGIDERLITRVENCNVQQNTTPTPVTTPTDNDTPTSQLNMPLPQWLDRNASWNNHLPPVDHTH